MKITTSIMLAVSAIPFVASSETWVCKDYYSSSWETLLTATIGENRASGNVDVAGTTHHTFYEVAGFDRKWWFGSNSARDGFGYVFTINPKGVGRYFDFAKADENGIAEESMRFTCQIKTPKS